MKNLIRIFLILVIVGAGISIGSSCSDENDCSLYDVLHIVHN